MEVTYIGHSCFKIKGKSATVVTDPYDSKITGYRLPKLEADILTISHDHPDHSAADSVTGAKLIVTKPGEYELMDTFVMAIPTFHDNKSGVERGGNL
jgi:L-ascorbate metabolism protein UlaG (beta-lactamase superfamily)